MDLPLQPFAFFWIGEDDFSYAFAIDFTFRPKDLGAKVGSNLPVDRVSTPQAGVGDIIR